MTPADNQDGKIIDLIPLLEAQKRDERAKSFAEIAKLAAHLSPTICPGCKNEIDPDVCHCGDSIPKGYHDNHSPVPLGCDCHRAKTPQEKLVKELEHPWG